MAVKMKDPRYPRFTFSVDKAVDYGEVVADVECVGAAQVLSPLRQDLGDFLFSKFRVSNRDKHPPHAINLKQCRIPRGDPFEQNRLEFPLVRETLSRVDLD